MTPPSREAVHEAIEKAIALTPVKNRNESAAMVHLLTHTVMVDAATDAVMELFTEAR